MSSFDLFLLNRVCGKGNQESQHPDCGYWRKSRGAVSPRHDWSGGNLLFVITVKESRRPNCNTWYSWCPIGLLKAVLAFISWNSSLLFFLQGRQGILIILGNMPGGRSLAELGPSQPWFFFFDNELTTDNCQLMSWSHQWIYFLFLVILMLLK